MRHVGRLQQWNYDKGFGFVTPHDGGPRAFVHVKAFQVLGRRPANGDLVSYATRTDAKGRLNAANVRFAGQRIPQPGATRADKADRSPLRIPRTAIGATLLLAIMAAMVTRKLPVVLALAYLLMSAVSFFAYGFDKMAARRTGYRRTPESTLHLFDLLGGWPGALIAQQQMRHKTMKAFFQKVFWISVVANLVVAGWLCRSGVAEAVSQLLPG